jgi:hypothetical protein
MNGNLYDSLVGTFYGMDVYNLPLPVLPPADLSIAAASFAQRYLADRESQANNTSVFGFDRTDNPYLRSIGLFSNLADGLVDGFTRHGGTGGGFSIVFGLDRLGPTLTGTISNAAGSATVSGVGTLFTRELFPAGVVFPQGITIAWLDDNKVMRVGIVVAIASDTSLTLTAGTASTGMFTGATTAVKAIPMVMPDSSTFVLQVPTLNKLFARGLQISDVTKIRDIRGTLTFPVATPLVGTSTMAVTGIGSKFTEDVTVGQYVRYNTGVDQRTLQVSVVASDTAMSLRVPRSGDLPVAFSYPPFSGLAGWMDSTLGVRAQIPNAMSLYTIPVDPAFGDTIRRLSFHVITEIEHSKTVLGGFV